MVLFLIHKNGHSIAAWLVLAIDAAGVCAVSSPNLAGSIMSSTGAKIAPDVQTAIGLACIGLVALATLTPVKRLRWKWLVYAGAVTYPLYLLHQEIGVVLIRALAPHFGRGAATILTVVVVLALALAVYLFVERPLGPRLRRAVHSSLESASARWRPVRRQADTDAEARRSPDKISESSASTGVV